MTKRIELPRVIQYGGELTRPRFWQEVYIASVAAMISARPTQPSDITDAYARELVVAANNIAEAAFRNHGPSDSPFLQSESPFVAAPDVKNDRDYESGAD